jgi:hypothetical protein
MFPTQVQQFGDDEGVPGPALMLWHEDQLAARCGGDGV